MMKLLDSITAPPPPSAILAINSNDVATISTVLATATRKATAATMALGLGAACIAPTITTSTESQDKANRLNLNCQSIISAKEGAITDITDKVGIDITDIVLRTMNGDYFKGINDYNLHEIVSAEITGADRPATNTLLDNISGILGYAFNFQKKVNTNMELLRARAAHTKSYCITVDDAQLTLVLLTNTERAKK